MEGKVFADGFSFKRSENAPDFVVGRMSLKVEEAIAFIKEHSKNGWINLDVKKARTGNFYVELDTFVSEKKENGSGGQSGGYNKPTPTAPKTNTKPSALDYESDDLPF